MLVGRINRQLARHEEAAALDLAVDLYLLGGGLLDELAERRRGHQVAVLVDE